MISLRRSPCTALGTRNIFLVGPMGSGKTAVGKQLARLSGLAFVDSDAEIERRTGVDIVMIFEKEGEPGFREREREAIDELTRRQGIVLSTGGGAVLLPENREYLRTRGAVVYLETSVLQQAQRVGAARGRPLLAGVEDPAQTLADLMKVRAPLYHEVADLVVRTDDRHVRVVAAQILHDLGPLPPPGPPYT